MEENITVNMVRNLNKHTVVGMVLISLIICASIVLSLAVYFVWAEPHAREQASPIVRGFHLTSEGEEKPVPLRKQFGFWTPSKSTNPPSNSTKDKWELLEKDDTRVEDFENYITSVSLGWRRYNQIGHGKSRKKNGYWWVVSVVPSFQYKSFIQQYQSIWGTSKEVYVEEYPNQSKYFEEYSNK